MVKHQHRYHRSIANPLYYLLGQHLLKYPKTNSPLHANLATYASPIKNLLSFLHDYASNQFARADAYLHPRSETQFDHFSMLLKTFRSFPKENAHTQVSSLFQEYEAH